MGDATRAPAPDSRELAELAGGWHSAYVHVPFCRRRCPYCDFAVVTPEEAAKLQIVDPVDRYLSAVVSEIGMEPPWAPLDAVNVGGGTPSTLDAARMRRLLDALAVRFGLAADAEVSIEANPEDWEPVLGQAWADAGVTRISFGVQSFDDDVLAALGRTHTAADAIAAVEGALAAGFRDVSLDLIYGTPAESETSWERSVATALALGVPHLSAYSLTVERGTELSRLVNAGAPEPDPDVQADRFEHVVAAAADAGLVHYEVSNFARPGHVARYNLATWAQGEYLAFGLGAHGHREGVRRRNIRRLDRYLDRIESGGPATAGTEQLGTDERELERLIVGLRRRCGVRAGDLGEALIASPDGRRLVEAGILRLDRGWLVIDRPLLTDMVGVALMSLAG